jgi:hypothetical protein
VQHFFAGIGFSPKVLRFANGIWRAYCSQISTALELKNQKGRIMWKYFILFAMSTILFCTNSNKISYQNELNGNKSKWESNNIYNYQFELKEMCNCIMNGTYLIVVKNNIVDTIIPDTTIYPEINRNQYSLVPTVDSLFKYIQIAIDDNADKLSVNYNKEYGYPEKIEIDMNRNAVDDEEYIEIQKFIIK